MEIRTTQNRGSSEACWAPDHPIIDTIHAGIIVIDVQYRILRVNRVAGELLALGPVLVPSDRETCHGRLHGEKGPCADCPLVTAGNPSTFQKALNIGNATDRGCFFKEFIHPWGEGTIITLHDVSREIWALRKTDLARKELQAKNILVERHRRESSAEKALLNRLLDHLPDALVLVDGQYRIQRKNSAAEVILPEGRADTCFGLFGLDTPCDLCPAKEGFLGIHGRKTNHPVEGQYFTEIIMESHETDGGLLLFRNTTRQIQLIEKIREQQETITRKNDILSGLVKLGTIMQKETDPQIVVSFFLDMFLPVCEASAAAVMIRDIRPGSLWFTIQKGFREEQITQLTRLCFSSRSDQRDTESILQTPAGDQPVRQLHITGGDGRRVGTAFLENPIEDEDENLISLYFEPLGAYLENRILTRQLEERANTDPLTGLFNRGYFEAALAEEEKKHAEFDIPYAVVVADVNGLKRTNDAYGHCAGDTLIMTVARHLASSIRETDCVARTGGDEFILLLANTADEGAHLMVARLENSVFRDVKFEAKADVWLPVTVSFGACGVDEVAPERMLQEADRRMYEAKESYYQHHQRYR
jgi:diguanylate cyclase (GGDEF)-like protein